MSTISRQSIIALLFFCPLAQANADHSLMTLQSAVLFALEKSPLVRSAQTTKLMRDLDHKTAVARLFPSADLTATHGLQNNIPIANGSGSTNYFTPNFTTPWYSSLNLGLTEMLYDNGTSLTQLAASGMN